MHDRTGAIALLFALGLLLATPFAGARQGEPPYSLSHPTKSAGSLPIVDVDAIDAAARRDELDAKTRAALGPHTKRLQVADHREVSIRPQRDGAWESLADGSQLWRVQVRAAGATDLRLGFGRYALPAGATLYVIGADDYFQGPYTSADGGVGGFNAPVLPGDTATIELRMPAGSVLSSDALELTGVGAGFRDAFGLGGRSGKADETGPGASGACNINVVCPLGQPYPNEIRAVAYYEFQDDDDHGEYICSGTLLADVPRDQKNYFLTAAHCIDSSTEAASIVAYWNYQSTQCSVLSEPPGGYLNDDQHGASLRATRADADFTLLELSQAPAASWSVYYAGWDASGAQPTGTIGIHHPSGDVKKITAGPAPSTTDSCIGTAGSSVNTHWATGPYTQGTTEGGSSGSGLFVPVNRGGTARVLIGTLSGGDAACNGSQPNLEQDCYGKFAVAWNGASASSRLRDWLDPGNTGTMTLGGGDTQSAPPLVHSTRHRPLPSPPLRVPANGNSAQP